MKSIKDSNGMGLYIKNQKKKKSEMKAYRISLQICISIQLSSVLRWSWVTNSIGFLKQFLQSEDSL